MAINKGLDTTDSCIPHIPALKAAGFTFVCRYTSHSAWKNMTVAEVHALSKAGISIVNVWESSGDHASFFTYQQGLMDGAAAFAFAQHIGQPFTAPIYFAVDYDGTVAQVSDYFKGVRDSLQKHGQIGKDTYNVGVYGSGAVCEGLKSAGYVSFTWRAQSLGWSGTRQYNDWNICQGPAATIAGMNADSDVSNGHGGGWMVTV